MDDTCTQSIFVDKCEAVEHLSFVKSFIQMCDEAWHQGWHERNGGNASYLLDSQELNQFFACLETPLDSSAKQNNICPWMDIDVCVPSLSGRFLLITGSGRYMQRVKQQPNSCLGIIEIGEQGNSYRAVWGLEGCRPTSELSSHLLIHEAKLAENPHHKVIYHGHPVDAILASKILPKDSKACSLSLWKTMTECIMVFPEGIAYVPFQVPGSVRLGQETVVLLKGKSLALWENHGILTCGNNCDAVFGLTHVVVKACEILVKTQMLAHGCVSCVSDAQLEQIVQACGLKASYLS